MAAILGLILLTISREAVGKPKALRRAVYEDYMPTRGDLPDLSGHETQFLEPEWTPAEVELTPEIIEQEFITTYYALDRCKIDIMIILCIYVLICYKPEYLAKDWLGFNVIFDQLGWVNNNLPCGDVTNMRIMNLTGSCDIIQDLGPVSKVSSIFE